MGLEATGRIRWSSGEAEVKALLETRELIIRGGFRRSFAFATLRSVRAEGESLHFESDGDSFALVLDTEKAARWAKKIAAPPPSLARKLGVASSSKALVIGAVEATQLREALAGCIAADATDARLSLAVIEDRAALEHALHRHETLQHGAPIWIVHGKGPAVSFGGNAVRSVMREAGYRDDKISSVSDDFSATRYIRR